MNFCDEIRKLTNINLIRSDNKETNRAEGSENKSEKDGDNTARKLLTQESEQKSNALNIDLNYVDLEALRTRAERVAQRKKSSKNQ